MDTYFAVSAVMGLVDNITGPLRNVRAGMASTEAQAGRLTSKMAGLTKALLPLAAAAGLFLGILAPSVGVAADFEAAISRVGAVSMASESEMAMLAKSAEDFGASTAFTPMQVASAQEVLARKGYEVNQIIAQMPGLLSMAAATNTDLATAAEISSGALKSFQMDAIEAGKVADIIAAATATSATNVEGLGMALQNAGAVVAGQRGDFALLAAVTGKLADANINAAVGSTALKIMTNRLAAPTGGAVRELETLGVAYKDLVTGDALPLLDVLKNIEIALQGKGTAQRAYSLKTIFGEEAIGSATALFNQGIDSLAEYHAYLQQITGTSDKMAQRLLNNFNGAVIILGSAWEGLKISIGSIFLPVLTPLIKAITNVIGWLRILAKTTAGKTFIALGAAMSTAVLGTIAFTAAGWGMALVLPVLNKGLMTFLGTLAGISWPIWAVIAAVAALVVAFKTNFMGIGDTLTRWWNNTRLVTQGVISVFKTLKNEVGSITGALSEDIKAAGLTGIVVTISKVLYRLWSFWAGWWGAFKNSFAGMGELFAPVWESIAQAFEPLLPVWQKMGAAITWVAQALGLVTAGSDVSTWRAFGAVIGSVVGGAFKLLAYVLRLVLTLVQMLMGPITALTKLLAGLWDILGTAGSWWADKLGGLLGLDSSAQEIARATEASSAGTTAIVSGVGPGTALKEVPGLRGGSAAAIQQRQSGHSKVSSVRNVRRSGGIHIENLNLPNVRSADDFIAQLQQLVEEYDV